MIKGRYRSPLKHSTKMKNFWTFPSDATEIQLNCGVLKRLLSQPVRCWVVNVHHVESNGYLLAQMWWLYHLDEILMTSKRPAGNHHSFWLWDWWFHCAGFAIISQWILLEGMCIHFMLSRTSDERGLTIKPVFKRNRWPYAFLSPSHKGLFSSPSQEGDHIKN